MSLVLTPVVLRLQRYIKAALIDKAALIEIKKEKWIEDQTKTAIGMTFHAGMTVGMRHREMTTGQPDNQQKN